MPESSTPTILIIDDDAHLIDGITRVLHREPYRILSGTNGDEALHILGSEPVDVLVSDEQMPGMTGADLVMAVRAQYPAVVSIMLSGQASMGAVIRALNQGEIYRFLIKPCSHEELAANIRQALRYKFMIDHCRRLLPLFRQQSQILASIENRLPGFIQIIDEESTTRALTKRITRSEGDAPANRLEAALTPRPSKQT